MFFPPDWVIHKSILGQLRPRRGFWHGLGKGLWRDVEFLPARHCEECGLHIIDTGKSLSREQVIQQFSDGEK